MRSLELQNERTVEVAKKSIPVRILFTNIFIYYYTVSI